MQAAAQLTPHIWCAHGACARRNLLAVHLLPCILPELKADCLPDRWIDEIDGNLWPDLDEPGCLSWCGESWKLVSPVCGGLALVRPQARPHAEWCLSHPDCYVGRMLAGSTAGPCSAGCREHGCRCPGSFSSSTGCASLVTAGHRQQFLGRAARAGPEGYC